MATQVKSKLAEQAEAIIAKAKAKTAATTETKTEEAVKDKFADIESNTFIKILSSKATPEEKKEAFTKALTFDKTQDKEVSLARLREYQLFKAYLQEKRTAMARKIISLLDTGAYSTMKNVVDKLYSSIIAFDESLKPLTDPLNAFYELRMAGKDEATGEDYTFLIFKEAKEGMKADAERQKTLAEKQEALQRIETQRDQNNEDIARLGEDTNFLGYVKRESAKEIAQKKLENERATAEAAAIAADIEALSKPSVESTKYAQFAKQKEQIMQMMNISDDGHVKQNEKLIGDALGFIDNTAREVNSVQDHLGNLEAQTTRLTNGNAKMRGIYAMLTDAAKDAATANKNISVEYKTPVEGEGVMSKMKREETLGTVNEFIKAMDFAMVDTLETYQSLAKEGVQVQAMGDMCQQQIADVNKIATSGIAGVAGSLATAVTGVAQTALNEAKELAKGALTTMNDRTISLTNQNAVSAAMGMNQLAEEFNQQAVSMTKMHEGLRDATKIREAALHNIKEATSKSEALARALEAAVKEATSVHADVDIQTGVEAAPKTAANDDKQSKKPAVELSL